MNTFAQIEWSLSTKNNPRPVAREIERELDLNRKVGLFFTPPNKHFTGSSLDAIPKKHSAPVKWSFVIDSSWPAGLSINDGIPKDLFLCNYDSLDCAITLLKHFGPGALMSKVSFFDTFRHILVHDGDWEPLGSTWQVEIDGIVNVSLIFSFLLAFLAQFNS